jgi:hypothetical protein
MKLIPKINIKHHGIANYLVCSVNLCKIPKEANNVLELDLEEAHEKLDWDLVYDSFTGKRYSGYESIAFPDLQMFYVNSWLINIFLILRIKFFYIILVF